MATVIKCGANPFPMSELLTCPPDTTLEERWWGWRLWKGVPTVDEMDEASWDWEA